MSRITPKPLKQYPWTLRLLYAFQKRKYGSALLPSLVWGRRPKLLKAFLRFGRLFEQKTSLLSPTLRSLIMVKVSQIRSCSFCVDLNSYLLLERTNNENLIGELSQYKISSLFSEKEKCAIEYAEVVTSSPKEVSDELFDRLKKAFSEDEIVELTALISFQLLSSTFNTALDIESHGFCNKTSP